MMPLWWQFTQRQVELRHKGSHLGLLWSIFNPLLMLGLYVMVFGIIYGGSFGVLHNETSIDYALAIFVGLSIHHLIAETITGAVAAITSNPQLVKKVVFPLELLPAAHVGSATIHYLISVVLVIIGIILVGPGASWGMLWWPIVTLPILLLAFGLGWLISALGVFFRDLAQIAGLGTTALLFASAVFYPVSKVPPSIWPWLRLNPLVHIIEMNRDCLLWHRAISLPSLAYTYIFSSLLFVSGWFFFRRLKPIFSDVI